ncbi:MULTISPECIES: hypothetical protein [unclassified Paraburkholderia]|uniref:hypothetical protein n=1 Tax=unclassified Paraburkholderia TaxID=2615204 RepID=UPI002AAF3681|nr:MULTISPECIES: hypothetical protein [unclassified Paraburkholderia]
MTDHLAYEPDTTIALKFRDELLARQWPSDHQVARLTGDKTSLEEGSNTTHARATGILLGVWSEHLPGFVYPDFQFDHAGAIREEIVELLAVLPRENDEGGWRRAFWLYSPHALLDGQTPADVFPGAPTRVIMIAQEEFQSAPDAAW